jgi:hypothetical protein
LEKEYGIHVSFCLVRKEFNQQADGLARAAIFWEASGECCTFFWSACHWLGEA